MNPLLALSAPDFDENNSYKLDLEKEESILGDLCRAAHYSENNKHNTNSIHNSINDRKY